MLSDKVCQDISFTVDN